MGRRKSKTSFSKRLLDLISELEFIRYIVDHGEATRMTLPWGPSKARYLLTNETPPGHPNGREFFYPVTYKGYTMESHYDRDRALKLLGSLCDRLEIAFEVIEA